MESELDKQASALICQKHCCLRSELEALRRQYQHHDDFARSYARRMQDIQAKLEDLTFNVDQFFCDALDMLRSTNFEDPANQVAKCVETGES